MRSTRHCVLVVALTAVSVPQSVHAEAFDSLEALSQENFSILAENLAAAAHYRGITPTEPLGLIGFDIGISLSGTSIDDEVLDLASAGDFETPNLFVPRLHVHKGLPFGIDIGGFVSVVPETDIRLLGAEIRKAIFEGTALTPAVGVRLGYSAVRGLDQLDFKSTSLDLSISKGVLMFTPYAGVGFVFSDTEASEEFNLDRESASQEKFYVGLNINLGFNVTLEADRVGEYNSFSAKAGIRF